MGTPVNSEAWDRSDKVLYGQQPVLFVLTQSAHPES